MGNVNRPLNHVHIFMKQHFSGNFTSAPLENFLPCAYGYRNSNFATVSRDIQYTGVNIIL